MKLKVQEIFEKRKVINTCIEIVPNRGRNFGPMLNIFSKEILNHEILVHIHSKASNGMAFRFVWSRILWRDLYLSKKKIKKNCLYFSDNKIGVLSTISLAWTPLVFSWGGSFDKAKTLFPEVASRYNDTSSFLYPIGGMFWARVEALRPIFENLQSYDIFPDESENVVAIRNGKTSEHAIERFIGLIPEDSGYTQIVRIHERRVTLTSGEFISKLYDSQTGEQYGFMA
jgi:lipopolysaccharide biosynthesis protein